MKRNTLLLIILVCTGSFFLMLISSRYSNEKIEAVKISRAQKNALQQIIDSTYDKDPVFNSKLKNKIVVINVWATWCAPCRKEIPELNKLVKDFGSDDVEFIALDDEDSTEAFNQIRDKKISFDYKLLFNREELIKGIRSFATVEEKGSIPINLILDKEGRIVHFHVGNIPAELAKMREYLGRETQSRLELNF